MRPSALIGLLETVVMLNAAPTFAEGDHADGVKPTRSEAESSPRSSSLVVESLTSTIASSFRIRSDRAETHAKYILSTLEDGDERAVVKDILSMTQSLTRDQKKDALKTLETAEDGQSFWETQALRRMRWVLEEALGEERGTSDTEQNVKGKVEEVKGEADAQSKKFQSDLDKAAEGDEEARRAILDRYKPEALVDYLAQHKSDPSGIKMARMLGWQDKNGVTHLDVMAPKEGGGTEPQTWTLGKTNEQIQTALNAFDSQSLTAPASTVNQLQKVAINHDVSNLADRQFLQVSPTSGQLVRHDPRVVPPEDRKAFCQKEDPAFIKDRKTEHRPYYFFRPFPEADMASYASMVNGVNRNFLKDMNSGKEKQIPGSWDPVPTPDELYMTIPTNNSSSRTKGIQIFAMKDLTGSNPDPKPIYEEDTKKFPDQKPLRGVYQSIGTVKKDMVSATYRIITDMDGLSFRDYRIIPGRKNAVEPQGDAPKRLCPELGKNISLPMLSKDGRFISFLDTKDNITKIYEIGERGDRCDLVGDLGIATSKVDFGFDAENPVVTFHKFNNQDSRETYPEVPSENLVANIYEFNLRTRKIRRLTNNTDANSIYPAFRRDGKIVYMQFPQGATESNTTPQSKFVVVDPNKVQDTSMDLFEDKDRLAAATAVGGLWAEVCSPYSKDFGGEAAALASLGMDGGACRRLVETYWDKFKADVASNARLHVGENFDSQRLLAGCPRPEDDGGFGGGGGAGDTGGGGGTSQAGVAPIIKKLCLRCHLGEIPWTDKVALNESGTSARGNSWLEEIAERVRAPFHDDSGEENDLHMPRGSEISDIERLELDLWIRSMR